MEERKTCWITVDLLRATDRLIATRIECSCASAWIGSLMSRSLGESLLFSPNKREKKAPKFHLCDVVIALHTQHNTHTRHPARVSRKRLGQWPMTSQRLPACVADPDFSSFLSSPSREQPTDAHYTTRFSSFNRPSNT